ncbi:MAG: ferritin-like domain-containing protein [Thermoleophilia bacterium]
MSEPRELFLEELGDIYYAEKTIEKMLGTLAREASDEELAAGFEEHRAQTREQIENVERVFEALGSRPKAKQCPGIDGIKEEHDEFMSEHSGTPAELCDLFLTGAASRTEHYEIAAYTGLVGMARALGERESASLLQENLRQEKETLKAVEAVAKRLAKSATPRGSRRSGNGSAGGR